MDTAKPKFGLIIDNKDVVTENSFTVHDSVTASVVHRAPTATVEQAIHAVESAEKAFQSWRNTTPIQRRTILNKAAQILEERKDELVRAMVLETGAKPSWAAFNSKTGQQFIMEGAGMTTQVKGEMIQSNEPGQLEPLFGRTKILLPTQERWQWFSKSPAASSSVSHPGMLP